MTKTVNFNEVYELPEDWLINPLDEICEKIFVGIATSTTNSYTEAGVPIIRNQNIKADKLDDSDILMITNDFSESNKSKMLLEGDILTVRTGYPGVSCVVPKEYEGSHSFTTLISRPNFNKVLPKYLSRFINSEVGKKAINSVKAGGAQQNLNVSVFSKIPIVLPPIKEQGKIVQILSTVDEQIDSTEQLIKQTNKLKKGLMQKLLTKGIGHTEFKKTVVGEIPLGWEVKKLGELAKYRRGSFPQPYNLPEWYDDVNGMPFVQVYDVDTNFKLKETTKRRISRLGAKSSVFAKKGTVIITLQGTLGRTAITQYDAYIDRTLLLFTEYLYPIDRIYFMYALNLLFESEKKKADGGVIKTITKETLTKFTLAVPPLYEQKKIAGILSSVDEQIENYTIKKEKLEQLKVGLMQQLLTGKIRVNN
ncbi:restriction endonuclease subunit S [Bacillus sp. HMF5848]|uniref:restriction endonuclease subunit S n=1 Tax=Bacillus sp. HMF5848 TaxID=2495421 RepID=UPI000F79E433|nr:restriction endonuclease subunit S [Bacillus sp. HMF5848]RSK25686.1 restriction endonuclease subunit S [Bacillus sp. HMF5848]